MKKFITVTDCGKGLADEWDIEANQGLRPDEVSVYSNMKAFWRRPSGELYQERISHRTKGCMKRKKEFPLHLLKEFYSKNNGPEPLTNYSIYSNKRVWWECSNGHVYEAVIKNRTRGSNCPYCSGKRVSRQNALAVNFPLVAAEWHPTKNGELTPLQITASSAKRIFWTCANGHEWQASVNNRKQGRNCPEC